MKSDSYQKDMFIGVHTLDCAMKHIEHPENTKIKLLTNIKELIHINSNNKAFRNMIQLIVAVEKKLNHFLSVEYLFAEKKSYMVVLSDKRSDANGEFLIIEIHKGRYPVDKSMENDKPNEGHNQNSNTHDNNYGNYTNQSCNFNDKYVQGHGHHESHGNERQKSQWNSWYWRTNGQHNNANGTFTNGEHGDNLLSYYLNDHDNIYYIEYSNDNYFRGDEYYDYDHDCDYSGDESYSYEDDKDICNHFSELMNDLTKKMEFNKAFPNDW
uniref:PI3K/PI4K domain-containing protein n=1 Tax=Strongyloides venezuelensis TaxID=75913 RepID=A0A0K0FB35_STRVS